ncbi:MAG TPA: hypothetical protein VFE57_09335, partial [Cyclobacteriaceae bacterium]|nr:hypothetical protein [Cyclobacteriaceae bacterium]
MGSKVLILLDADVIIHFQKAGRLELLTALYSNRLRILDIIVDEELTGKTIVPVIENLLASGLVEKMSFPSDEDILMEYLTLRKQKLGKGESACMAVCRFHNEILASSNLRDIAPYCAQHGIAYLTTMDIFAIACLKKVLTSQECDEAIRTILAKDSK